MREIDADRMAGVARHAGQRRRRCTAKCARGFTPKARPRDFGCSRQIFAATFTFEPTGPSGVGTSPGPEGFEAPLGRGRWKNGNGRRKRESGFVGCDEPRRVGRMDGWKDARQRMEDGPPMDRMRADGGWRCLSSLGGLHPPRGEPCVDSHRCGRAQTRGADAGAMSLSCQRWMDPDRMLMHASFACMHGIAQAAPARSCASLVPSVPLLKPHFLKAPLLKALALEALVLEALLSGSVSASILPCFGPLALALVLALALAIRLAERSCAFPETRLGCLALRPGSIRTPLCLVLSFFNHPSAP